MPWQDRGACRNHPKPDLWFPLSDGGVPEAQDICFEACPVRKRCLEFAMRHEEEHGIWGGLSVRERRKLRRQRKKAS